MHQRIAEATKANEEISPEDSASVANASGKLKKGSKAPSSVDSKVSSASVVHLKAELERAELQALALKQKWLLDEQEAKIKAEREEWQVQTTVAASDAKCRVLEEFEGIRASSKVSHQDGMNYYLEKAELSVPQALGQATTTPQTAATVEPASSGNHGTPTRDVRMELRDKKLRHYPLLTS